MQFIDLRPGDEITIRIYGRLTCRAKVTNQSNGAVTAFLWNSIAERWNRNPVRIKPDRVLEYPERR